MVWVFDPSYLFEALPPVDLFIWFLLSPSLSVPSYAPCSVFNNHLATSCQSPTNCCLNSTTARTHLPATCLTSVLVSLSREAVQPKTVLCLHGCCLTCWVSIAACFFVLDYSIWSLLSPCLPTNVELSNTVPVLLGQFILHQESCSVQGRYLLAWVRVLNCQ